MKRKIWKEFDQDRPTMKMKSEREIRREAKGRE